MGQYDISNISVVLTQIDERLTDNPDTLGGELIPIAILFAGDFVCLDYRKSSKPSICIWFHEKSEVFAPGASLVNVKIIMSCYDDDASCID